MKNLLICAVAGALLCTPALAQPQQGGGNVGNGNFGAGGGAVFQLPPSVKNVVSIDAHNMIIIESEGERDGETQYTPSIIRHVYSGGIARLFGGSIVPTAPFVTPGIVQGGLGGGVQGNNGGFGGNNNGLGNGGFNGGGFNNGGFNNGNNFQNGGGLGNFNNGGNFNGGVAFGNTVLQGNGFNTQNGNTRIDLNIRAR